MPAVVLAALLAARPVRRAVAALPHGYSVAAGGLAAAAVAGHLAGGSNASSPSGFATSLPGSGDDRDARTTRAVCGVYVRILVADTTVVGRVSPVPFRVAVGTG